MSDSPEGLDASLQSKAGLAYAILKKPPMNHHYVPELEWNSLIEGANLPCGKFLPSLPNMTMPTPATDHIPLDAKTNDIYIEPGHAWTCCGITYGPRKKRCTECKFWKNGERSKLKRKH